MFTQTENCFCLKSFEASTQFLKLEYIFLNFSHFLNKKMSKCFLLPWLNIAKFFVGYLEFGLKRQCIQLWQTRTPQSNVCVESACLPSGSMPCPENIERARLGPQLCFHFWPGGMPVLLACPQVTPFGPNQPALLNVIIFVYNGNN